MSPLDAAAAQKCDGSVMIVDDNPANLKLLEEMLSASGYEVRSFPRGRLALAAARREAPDLILLDINMPEMDGYEVCRQLKAAPALAAIPVIFLSALHAIEDKVRGFRAGGIDYIPKPFQFEEVHARVEAQVGLRRARRVEQELLEKTLGGAVQTLWDVVQLTAPALAARSRAVRDIVAWVAKRMSPAEGAWQYELAATLCFIGCLTVPNHVFDMAYAGQSLTDEEKRMYAAHPEVGARLLSNIPRLEAVAEAIRFQQEPSRAEPADGQARTGAALVKLAQEVDRRICRGLTFQAALAEVENTQAFDGEMLHALRGYSAAQPEYVVRRVRAGDLRSGMILEQDVFNNRLLILGAGTVLTEAWIERLSNFAHSGGAFDLLAVRVPKNTSALEPRARHREEG